MNRRFLLEAGGLSLLLVFPFIAPLLVPGNLSLLHHRLTFEEKMGGILLDIAFFFLLGVGTCLLVQKMPKFPRSFVSGLTLSLVVSRLLVRSIFHITVLLWPTLVSDSSST